MRVVQVHEPELLARPQRDLLADATQVHTEQREDEQCLGDEVAIAHRVERVLEPGREAEILRDTVGVERERRAGERAGAERRDVGPAQGVEQPVDVASECPAVGQQMVGEENGLGPLQMGVAREVGVLRLDGALQQHLLQRDDAAGQLRQCPLHEQPEIGGDLIVAAAAGVQLGAGRSGQLGDPPLDRGVHVLVAGRELEDAVVQLLLDAVERGDDDRDLVVGEDPGPTEPAHVGPRAGDVVGREPHVEGHAGGVGHQLLGRVAGEATLPERHARSRPGPWRAAHVSTLRPHSRTNPAESSCLNESASS